jgi:hypothetical protein
MTSSERADEPPEAPQGAGNATAAAAQSERKQSAVSREEGGCPAVEPAKSATRPAFPKHNLRGALDPDNEDRVVYIEGFKWLRESLIVERDQLTLAELSRVGCGHEDFLQVCVISDPGKVLRPAVQQTVMSAMKDISREAFPDLRASVGDYWDAQHDRGYFARLSELFLVTNQSDQIVGFSGYSVLSGDGYLNVHLDISAFVGEAQRRRAMDELIKKWLKRGSFSRGYRRYLSKTKGEGRLFISTFTQILAVYEFAESLVERLYPGARKQAAQVDEVMGTCVRELLQWSGIGDEKFRDPRHALVQRNLEDASFGLWPEPGRRPLADKAYINQFFDDLSLGSRDAVLLIGRATA